MAHCDACVVLRLRKELAMVDSAESRATVVEVTNKIGRRARPDALPYGGGHGSWSMTKPTFAQPNLVSAQLALTRRTTLIGISSSLAVMSAGLPAKRSRTIVLSEESVAIARDLVARGYHRTVEEAVLAAVRAMMVREKKQGLA
jgi:hypothetical protein